MSPLAQSALAAALHLLALGLGLGAIWTRYRALKGPLDEAGIQRVLTADNIWGLAAMLWIGTGLWRALGSVAKTWAWYKMNWLFHTKMTVFIVLFLMELVVMIPLIRWRIARGKGQLPDLSKARRFATISLIQAHLIVVMLFIATFMARGAGMIIPK